jgi:hypothetical protein
MGGLYCAEPTRGASAKRRCPPIHQAIDVARSELWQAELRRSANDLTVVNVHGLTNHRVDRVERLFRIVAEQTPGSYGLLYVRNGEDPRGLEFENRFRVWRLARGELTEMPDNTL